MSRLPKTGIETTDVTIKARISAGNNTELKNLVVTGGNCHCGNYWAVGTYHCGSCHLCYKDQPALLEHWNNGTCKSNGGVGR